MCNNKLSNLSKNVHPTIIWAVTLLAVVFAIIIVFVPSRTPAIVNSSVSKVDTISTRPVTSSEVSIEAYYKGQHYKEADPFMSIRDCNVEYALQFVGYGTVSDNGYNPDYIKLGDFNYLPENRVYERWILLQFTEDARLPEKRTDRWGNPTVGLYDYSYSKGLDSIDPLDSPETFYYNDNGYIGTSDFSIAHMSEEGFCHTPAPIKWTEPKNTRYTEVSDYQYVGTFRMYNKYWEMWEEDEFYVGKRLSDAEMVSLRYDVRVNDGNNWVGIGYIGNSHSSKGYDVNSIEEDPNAVKLTMRIYSEPEWAEFHTGITVPLNTEILVHTNSVSNGHWQRFVFYRNSYGAVQMLEPMWDKWVVEFYRQDNPPDCDSSVMALSVHRSLSKGSSYSGAKLAMESLKEGLLDRCEVQDQTDYDHNIDWRSFYWRDVSEASTDCINYIKMLEKTYPQVPYTPTRP